MRTASKIMLMTLIAVCMMSSVALADTNAYYYNGDYINVTAKQPYMNGFHFNNTHYFVADSQKDIVARYNSAGTYQANFSTASEMENTLAVYYNGTDYFVTGSDNPMIGLPVNQSIHVYNSTEDFIAEYDISGQLNAPYGIASDGTYLYVTGGDASFDVGYDNRGIYKYYMNGTYTGINYTNDTYDQNYGFYGASYYGGYIYTAYNDTIYRFNSADLTIDDWYLDTNYLIAIPQFNGTYFYVGDTSVSGAYIYEWEKAGIHVCDVDYTTHVIDFYIFNEENNANQTAELDVAMTLWDTTQPSIYNESFSHNFTGDNNYSLCIFPAQASLNTWSHFDYYNSTLTERNYYLANATLTNVTTPIYLYLTSGTDKIYMYVRDGYDNLLSDVIIMADRYYVVNDTYKNIGMAKTGFDGSTHMNLKTNNTWYKFHLINYTSGEVIRTFTPMLISTNTLNFKTTPSSLDPIFKYWDDIATSCSYNNTSSILSCTAIDTTGEMQETYLEIIRYTTLGKDTICDTSGTGSSVTLTCNVTGNTTGELLYTFYGNQCCSIPTNYIFETGSIDFNTGLALGLTGIFLSLLIIITLSGIGAYISPELCISFGLLGFVICSFIGFWTVSAYTVIAMIVSGALILYKVRN